MLGDGVYTPQRGDKNDKNDEGDKNDKAPARFRATAGRAGALLVGAPLTRPASYSPDCSEAFMSSAASWARSQVPCGSSTRPPASVSTPEIRPRSTAHSIASRA